jgi:hypothetical protein
MLPPDGQVVDSLVSSAQMELHRYELRRVSGRAEQSCGGLTFSELVGTSSRRSFDENKLASLTFFNSCSKDKIVSDMTD